MMTDDTRRRFEALRQARLDVQDLAKTHIAALQLFHAGGHLGQVGKKVVKVEAFDKLLPDTATLAILAGNKEISIASSVTCVKSLLSCPSFRPEVNVDFSGLLGRIDTKRAAARLRTGGLTNGNAFTVGLLLPMLKQMKADPACDLVKVCIAFAKKAVANEGARIAHYPPNGYLTYWNLVGLQSWGEDVSTTCDTALAWSCSELYRQIAFFESGSDQASDAYQLAYNILIQKRFSREHLHDAVLKKGLAILFKAQLGHGVWEKKAPLFVYAQGGDAYCFCFEMLNSLLNEFLSEPTLLANYQENLDRAFRWLGTNRDKSNDVPLWRSGHRHDNSSPESWATAEVYLFLQQYKHLLTAWMQSAVLDSFRSPIRGGVPKPDAFSGFFHPDVTLPKEKISTPLSNLLAERLCDPLKVTLGGVEVFSLSENPDAKRRVRSGVLFGPPGTGKTSYVRAIALYLGWPLVILDPSDFACDGLHLIASTTSKVFDALLELENTVIFFDEMEEMLHKRRSDGSSFEQRFLTTSLLPKLQYLADKANTVFFVATNHYEEMDDAAKRDGRFDFRIQVLPPSFNEKLRLLNESLAPGEPEASLLKELTRDEVKKEVAWATIMQTRVLFSELKGKTDVEIAHILGDFKATIQSTEYEKDECHNVFPRI
jgi:hypothetical protein